jgi:Spy/CpxP family protein refolding chaperone
MKKSALILAMVLGVTAWTAMAQDAGGSPPAGQRPPGGEGPGAAPGGPGGPGGFHLLPPRAAEHLNLTDDQRKQLADLEAEVKAKIEKILTPEQLQQLKQMRPPMRPGGPGPGQHGPGAEERPPHPPQDQ